MLAFGPLRATAHDGSVRCRHSPTVDCAMIPPLGHTRCCKRSGTSAASARARPRPVSACRCAPQRALRATVYPSRSPLRGPRDARERLPPRGYRTGGQALTRLEGRLARPLAGAWAPERGTDRPIARCSTNISGAPGDRRRVLRARDRRVRERRRPAHRAHQNRRAGELPPPVPSLGSVTLA